MTMKTILAGTVGLAALAVTTPAAAQYYPYGYSPYRSYGYSPYAYGYGMNTTAAAQQCTAAVQSRLYYRNSAGGLGILGTLFGLNTPATSGRVLNVTQVRPLSNGAVRVRGLATSGRIAYNGYGPYGVGAYGALGYGYAPAADLSFKCDVDYRGYIRDVDIYRR